MSKAIKIYQIKISLEHVKPPIWRRVLINSDTSLAKLHYVIQMAMGWDDYHLHQFITPQGYYGIPEPDIGFMTGDTINDESKVTVATFLKAEKDAIKYEYDFGDSWVHKIQLEKILPPDKSIQLPQCIKGKRACPPEDCGGVWGYQELVEIVKDPSHEEYDDMIEWLGEDEYDPDSFDMDFVNMELQSISR